MGTRIIERPSPRRGLSREEAALCLGVPSKFDESRKDGRVGSDNKIASFRWSRSTPHLVESGVAAVSIMIGTSGGIHPRQHSPLILGMLTTVRIKMIGTPAAWIGLSRYVQKKLEWQQYRAPFQTVYCLIPLRK